MNFYLSKPFPDILAQQPFAVKVNNMQAKKKWQPQTEIGLVPEPDDGQIQWLNDLASRPPFSNVHRAKKYDPL